MRTRETDYEATNGMNEIGLFAVLFFLPSDVHSLTNKIDSNRFVTRMCYVERIEKRTENIHVRERKKECVGVRIR